MTDPLDDLKAALKAAAPAPDAAARAQNLAAAEQAFAETIQERATDARPFDEPAPGVGAAFVKGAQAMFKSLTSRAGLAATSSLVVAGFALVVVLPSLQTPPPGLAEDGPALLPEGSLSKAAEAAPAEVLDAVDAEEAAPQAEPAPVPGTALSAQDALSDDGAMTPLGAAPPAAAEAEAAEAPVRMPVQPAKPAPRRTIAGQPKPSADAPQRSEKRVNPGLFFDGGQTVTTAHNLPPSDRADALPRAAPNTEAFPQAETNPVKVTAEEPVSTFSIDVDTASYAIVRDSLMRGQLPPKAAVRAEEMINYFPYAYPGPEGDTPFATQVTVTQTPWNSDTQVVHIALQGALPALEDRPPLNLVFLIDSSGSMRAQAKLPLLKQSIRMMLGELRPDDQVAIITYAGSAGEVLAPTAASDASTILAALDQIEAGGGTAGQAGLQQAYATAEKMTADGEVSRILLATDGDFNIGLSDPEALKDYIADKRETGTYLSVLGFGRGNLNDATMQALAQSGNGTAAYIDTLSEARKVLVDQLSGALFPIADDVKIQVEFNPATVAEYRLIGYETRALRREDFKDDKVDAGEIGAGHAVTAIYEITPVGSPAVRNEPLRYGGEDSVQSTAGTLDELGFLRLRYKAPGADVSQLSETPIGTEVGTADTEVQFALAIAGFAQILKGETYLGDWGYEAVIDLALQARGEDPFGYRSEAIQLMRLAQSFEPVDAQRPTRSEP